MKRPLTKDQSPSASNHSCSHSALAGVPTELAELGKSPANERQLRYFDSETPLKIDANTEAAVREVLL
jgi:hypothetical protein